MYNNVLFYCALPSHAFLNSLWYRIYAHSWTRDMVKTIFCVYGLNTQWGLYKTDRIAHILSSVLVVVIESCLQVLQYFVVVLKMDLETDNSWLLIMHAELHHPPC